VSNEVLKRTLIFALLMLLIGSGVAGFRLANQYKKVAHLNQSELDLQRLKPKPPVEEDCSDVERTLSQLSRPKRAIDKRPPARRGKLTSDETAVYRAVLKQWLAGDRDPLNVSVATYPLDVLSETLTCECLKGIDHRSLLLASNSMHSLTSDILPRENVRLVDPDSRKRLAADNDMGNSIASNRSVETAVDEAVRNGLFSLSEIAFDTEHRRAIVSYSFVCGLLCGSGRTLVLEKICDEWKPAEFECGGWVS